MRLGRVGGLRAAILVVAALAVASCTSSLFYNRLDTVASWYVGNLVTLNENQQNALRGWLARTLAWHRGNELERYEGFLRELAGQVASGPDPSLYRKSVQQAETFMQDLAGRLAPEAAGLLLSLQPAQIDELLANLEERDLEELDEERERTDADRSKRRTRSLTRQLERWTGTATDEQKAIIERTVGTMTAAGLLGEDEEWFASQAAWRKELKAALGSGDDNRAQVEALLRDPSRSHSAAHVQAEAAERQQFLDLVIELDATLTDRQRITLSRKLTELAQDISALQAV